VKSPCVRVAFFHMSDADRFPRLTLRSPRDFPVLDSFHRCFGTSDRSVPTYRKSFGFPKVFFSHRQRIRSSCLAFFFPIVSPGVFLFFSPSETVSAGLVFVAFLRCAALRLRTRLRNYSFCEEPLEFDSSRFSSCEIRRLMADFVSGPWRLHRLPT